ncbi:MAG: hypothetical protein WAT39_13990 [Planctomycetota bacterium]
MPCPHRLLGVAIALVAGFGHAQDVVPPKIELLTRINHGMGGILRFADGTRREFHLEVTGTRARLLPSRTGEGAATGLPFGSDVERALLVQLDAWADAAFSAEERAELLVPERLPDPRSEAEDRQHARASLLRTLHAYHRVTRPTIDKVFAGRGTVTLSMQLRLGDDPPRQVLWRNLGDQPFARMHRGTEEQPVALDSRDERWILLAMRYWLAARLGSADVWAAEAKDVGDDVRLVLDAFRGYLTATSPRLRSAGTIMDAGNNGSKAFELSDARNRTSHVRFDHAANTPTPGRLREGVGADATLVDLGSDRERELLAMLRAAAALRRAFAGEQLDADWQLRMLEAELSVYERQFPARK